MLITKCINEKDTAYIPYVEWNIWIGLQILVSLAAFLFHAYASFTK